MGFFDLNIPYHESSKLTKQNTKLKETRTKLVGKAMELGYTGIAYNHTISGVMSDNDFCTISLISLSSLIKLSPFFPSSVKLHREALSVPVASPFRQYTRVTVVVDNEAQANLINSGNAVLKSYDLVAVRPTNKEALKQACKVSEVDIIAIDFGENKSFRLEQGMVKAAVQRGVYFEIAYSDLLVDARTRRRVIDNAKLLVNWTGGKNLIFSSSAPSANELRGPYDVANLMSLIGVPMERAKAANSKNCRTLVANALRRRHFYKETIRVEAIAPEKPVDSKEPWYADWLKWDPISSGEGDLLLEDMAKSFADAGEVTKKVKAIDFASIMDNIPSHGFQFKNLITKTNGVSKQATIGSTLLDDTPNLIITSTGNSFSPKDTHEDLSKAREIKADSTTMEGVPKSLNGLGSHVAAVENATHESPFRTEMDVDLDVSTPLMNGSALQDEKHKSLRCDGVSSKPLAERAKAHLFSSSNLSLSDTVFDDNQVMDMRNEVLPADQKQLVHSDEGVEGYYVANHEQIEDVTMADRDQGEHNDINHQAMNESMTGERVKNLREDGVLLQEKRLLNKCNKGFEGTKNLRDDEALRDDKRLLIKCDKDVGSTDGYSALNGEPRKEMNMKAQDQVDDHAEVSLPTPNDANRGKGKGKGKGKLRTPTRGLGFPFKRLLNPIPFKKKARKSKNKIKSA